MSDTLGSRLRTVRRAKQIPLPVLGARLDVSKGHLNDIELGRKQASIPMLERIAEALGVPAAKLMAQDEGIGSLEPAFRADLREMAAERKITVSTLVAGIEWGAATDLPSACRLAIREWYRAKLDGGCARPIMRSRSDLGDRLAKPRGKARKRA